MAAAQVRRQQAQRDLGLGLGLGRGLGLGVGKHTETLHRLPTIRQHPEKETLKNNARRLHKLPKHSPSSVYIMSVPPTYNQYKECGPWLIY